MNSIDINNFSNLLYAEDFDPIDFLNHVFPNESALEMLPSVAIQIDQKALKIDEEISQNIRKSAKVGEKSREIVNNSKLLIDDVTSRIAKLQTQATDTEHIVEDVCGSIKKYDGAKNNLTQSITTLKRLQMASIAVSELEMMANQKNFGECADRILALTTLMEFFKDFEKNDLLDDINKRFEIQKRQIHNLLSGEFETKLFGDNVDPSIATACRAVDAFGEKYRNEIVDMFCSRFLEGYQETFKNSPLSEIDRRYNWLKQRIDFYVLEYSKIFPQKWRVPYKLSYYFCSQTKVQIRDLLARTKPSIRDFQDSFQKTTQFEFALANIFPSSFPDEKAAANDENNTNTNNNNNNNNNKGEIRQNEFIGVISGAFAKHTDLYIAGEKEYLKNFVIQSRDNIIAKSSGTVDTGNRVFRSGIELVNHIKDTIDKCVGFALFDLFPVFKDAVLDYIVMVKGIMPSRIPGDETRKRCLRYMCVMSNTTFYFCSIIDTLVDRVSKRVTEDQKPLVRVDDTKDTLTDYNKSLLVSIARALCEETRPILDVISQGNWQTCTENNLKFPNQLCNHFNKTFVFLKKWISEDNFPLLRTLFVPEWVNNYFIAIFKGKQPLTFAGTEILAKATNMIKNVMINRLATGNEVTIELHKKIIEKDFDLIINATKVLASPEDAMAPIYKELFSRSPSKEQFAIIVRAKGLPQATEIKVINKY